MDNGNRDIGIHEYLFRFRSIETVNQVQVNHSPFHQQLVFSYVLVVTAAGEARMMIDSDHYEMRRGSVCLIKPEHTLGSEALSEDVTLYLIRFDVYGSGEEGNDLLKDVKSFDLPQAARELMISPPDKLVALCEELYRTSRSEDELSRFKCQIDFQSLLYFIQLNSRIRQVSTDSALEQVKKYVEEQYTEPLTVHQLAHMAELSSNYFVDLFKKRFGRSVMDYVAELRLQEAKRLLSLREWKLRDIANRVGYGDEFYFSRKFKKQYGISPKTYMKSRTRKLIAYEPAVLGYLIPLRFLPYAAPLHPKWTEYYYRNYRNEIPTHTHVTNFHQVWESNLQLLKPLLADIVIASDEIREEEKRLLATIAPRICYLSSTLTWREQLRYLGDQLGEKWKAEKWLEEYDHKVSSCREQIQISQAITGKRFISLRMAEDRLYLYCNRGMSHVLNEDLGLLSAHRDEVTLYDENTTLEELARIRTDMIFLLVRQDSETLDSWKKLQNDPAWMRIDAVKRNRLYILTSDPWREYSAHAQLRMLEQATQLLSEDRP
ncbi:AraC family transcriptional regulator [Cohnella herbarum]|uniref:AraC family transcriptional regulator n=1 Tax=Cohnella herbarum TaxID=2728023 RepID=UPI0020C1CE50|nr:AraC family transcriptional regulator [Cohnella herbarum]